MALSDYRLCDVCDGKVFYDARFDYQFQGEKDYSGDPITEDDCAKIVGEKMAWGGYKLQYLGDWAVICDDCAKTHRTQIVKIEGDQS